MTDNELLLAISDMMDKKLKPLENSGEASQRREIPASCAFVPSVAGLIIAGEVIKDLIK